MLLTNSADEVDLQFRLGAFYSGDVYVRTGNAGALQWSEDGSTYQTITNATFAGKKTVKLSMSWDVGAEIASNFDADSFNAMIVGRFRVAGYGCHVRVARTQGAGQLHD